MRNTTAFTSALLALTSAVLIVACGDDDPSAGGTDTTAATTTDDDPSSSGDTNPTTDTTTGITVGTETSSADTSTDGSSSASSSDTSTGEAPLTPDDLVGSFTSTACEAYPDGNGGTNYLTRHFTLTTDTWHLDLGLFMDAACTTPLFSSVIDGPYELGGSAAVQGATEGQFGITTNVWTAHQPFMAQLFTDSGCGDAPWELEVPQDVAMTGCIGVAHPIDECPQEYDIVALDGDALYFGERITDLCVPEGRPAALNAYAVVRR
jgi:hypothetical protein